MLLEWLGPALILLAPQVFWRDLTAAYILPKLLLMGLGAGLVGAAAMKRRVGVRSTTLDAPLAGLAAASVASALGSIDPWLSLLGRHGGFSDGLWGLAAAGGCWFAGSWLDDERRAALPRVALWAGAAAAAHAVLQHLGADPWKIGPLPTGRAVGGVGSPVDLGGLLALLFPLAVSAAARDDRPPAERALVLLYLTGLAATGSRAAWLGAAAGAAAVAALSPRSAAMPWRRWGLVALLAVAAAVTMAWRAGALRTFRDADSARLVIWRVAWRAVVARPVLGYGPGTFEHAFRYHRDARDVKQMLGASQLQDHAHNGVLNALAQGGALGLAAWVWVCLVLGRALWSARASPAVAAAAGAATAVAVILLVDPLSVEVLATAAFLISAALSAGNHRGARPWGFPAGLAAVGLLVALTAARLIPADRRAQLAAREPDPVEALRGYEAALAAVPGCTPYAVSYVNRLGDAINAAQGAPAKAALLEKGFAAGRDIARRRPYDMKAHYTLGIALLMGVQLGLSDRLPGAAAALDEARHLDPWHEPLLASRLEVARRQNDAPAVAELTGLLAQLR